MPFANLSDLDEDDFQGQSSARDNGGQFNHSQNGLSESPNTTSPTVGSERGFTSGFKKRSSNYYNRSPKRD